MAYQVVNEEFQIYSCSIADLTLKQTSGILKQWEDGANIGQLTMFYEPNTERLVINRDRKDYELYLEIAERFMGASERNREKVLNHNSGAIINELNVLNDCVKDRAFKQEVKRIYENAVPNEYSDTLERLYKREPGCFGHSLAFIYGMMCGKREERAKKKNKKMEDKQLTPELEAIAESCTNSKPEALLLLKKIAVNLQE